ncbi:MAG TPA: hypothetical protein VF169_21945 [Albitalea sp.]|uniref:hypothetical protein n=1 Tax=Piscinibacter sp. TaxID=1903157 RepID=UPI002ED51DED
MSIVRMHPGIATACAGAPPSREGTLDAGTWFVASGAHGVLRLCAFAGAPAPCHAVDAALALHRCEPLLGALDRWLGQDLAWRWSETPMPRAASATHAWVRWTRADAELECMLALPWSLMRSLPAPPEELASCLQWPDVPVMLVVSQCRIDAEELQLLEPGGAVVLAESLQRPWHGVLRAADEPAWPGAGVRVVLDPPSTPRLAGSIAARDEAPGMCEVRVATSRSVSGDRLAGWFTDEAIGEVGPLAGLWRCAEPAQWLASGRLMPWGDGWALHIESTCAPL